MSKSPSVIINSLDLSIPKNQTDDFLLSPRERERITQKIFVKWHDLLNDDGIFQDVGVNEDKWVINQDNYEEFFEALRLSEYISVGEMKSLLLNLEICNQKDQESEDSEEFKPVSYLNFRVKLVNFLLIQKEVNFMQLLQRHYSLPIDRISNFLNMLKQDFQQSCQVNGQKHHLEQFYLQEIQYTFKKMSERALFTSNQQEQPSSNKSNTKNNSLEKPQEEANKTRKGRMSVRLQWMNEFSDICHESNSNYNLKMAKQDAVNRETRLINGQINKFLINQFEVDSQSVQSSQKPSKDLSVVEEEDLELYKDLILDSTSLNFNLFDFSTKIKKSRVLPTLAKQTIESMNLMQLVNHTNLNNFLNQIQKSYRSDIQYHNDLHGTDVMLMTAYCLNQCQLTQILNLNKLDQLSMIIAAVCHDVGHDGFTNSFHVNMMTARSIESNDIAVQETFHAAELFRVLGQPNCNFAEGFSREEFILFRKRVVGIILATDMAKHAADLSVLNKIINENEINQDHKNLKKFLNEEDNLQLFKKQQMFCEAVVHACDISNCARSFKVVHDWTYLLFEEFFAQGDIEREHGLPISMLCDRNTTSVCGSQYGFINFVTLPAFTAISYIMPNLLMPGGVIDQMKQNCKTWVEYKETEEDKKVYKKKEETFHYPKCLYKLIDLDQVKEQK